MVVDVPVYVIHSDGVNDKLVSVIIEQVKHDNFMAITNYREHVETF